MLPTKFQVRWPFGSVEETKNRISRCRYFDLQVTEMLPTEFQANRPFGSGEEAKIDFQDGRHGSHLGFPNGTVLAIFELQATPMLPT